MLRAGNPEIVAESNLMPCWAETVRDRQDNPKLSNRKKGLSTLREQLALAVIFKSPLGNTNVFPANVRLCECGANVVTHFFAVTAFSALPS
jgi:hypothetical protein